ncbi:hypothetical protein [Pontibacter virosus]|uniref:Uncharacterized protein n=1 Tax=Pontibacter virosus TaxID=1765052 RepID=A0A2U1AX14_9BACT|nr:hypothetical protein [Pontibacter virosus]PVY40943.1 hypothetical protein C8E01_106285 [Pontibacter virosus]
MNLFIFLSGPASFADLMLLVLLWIVAPIALLYLAVKILMVLTQKKNEGFDYWSSFDNLVNSLRERDEQVIAKEFEESKRLVNGTTDGWFEFLNDFRSAVNKNNMMLTSEESTTAHDLIDSLEETLRKNNNT